MALPRFRLILSPEAADDLRVIHDYIALDSPKNAAEMVERILNSISRLDLFPNRNLVERRSRKIRRPVRSLPVASYIVYFRVLEEQQAVRVLTVRHGARRQPKRFK